METMSDLFVNKGNEKSEFKTVLYPVYHLKSDLSQVNVTCYKIFLPKNIFCNASHLRSWPLELLTKLNDHKQD